MKIPLYIEKDDEKDCSKYTCIFRQSDSDIEMCTLFNEAIQNKGYYDSRWYEACPQCQELYRKTVEGGNNA